MIDLVDNSIGSSSLSFVKVLMWERYAADDKLPTDSKIDEATTITRERLL